ncbi:hypothetical protein AB5J62_43825 [Amycolatopsis sp. cg5]|uniref:hypothetical protein n=1 Tax=Amycolatopsis sp. cg5 TaxID=3238802 RepID=UPI00352581FE
MTGFSVDPEELRDTSTALREVTIELRDQATLKYQIDSKQVGDDVLADALQGFQDEGKAGVRMILDTTAELAGRLRESAGLYETFDNDTVEVLRPFGEQA